jgi:hypothetical protein
MLEATIFTLTSVGVRIAFGSTRYFTAKQNVGRVKSFVDDLTMERGTVSMRVAFVLRSAEVQPAFRDLCDGMRKHSSCQFSPTPHKHQQYKSTKNPLPITHYSLLHQVPTKHGTGSRERRDVCSKIPRSQASACKTASGGFFPCHRHQTPGSLACTECL